MKWAESMKHPVELTRQRWAEHLPCGDCLHDIGASCGMAGAAPCPLLDAAMRGAPSTLRKIGGRLTCSAFEPGFAAAEPGCLH